MPESETFLNGKPKEEVQIEVQDKSSKQSCCTKKCCLVALAIAVGLVGLVVIVGYIRYKTKYEGTAEEATQAEILKAVESGGDDVVSGIYKLVKWDENYASYLEAVGVPTWVIPLITGAGFNEVIRVEKPEKETGVWTWEHTKSSGKRENWFRLGEEFEFEYGDKVKGIKHKTCNMEEENVLLCQVEERKKGLNMTERYRFGAKAMVQEISLLTGADITTVRLFERTTEAKLLEEKIKEEEEARENDPFGDSADDEDFRRKR